MLRSDYWYRFPWLLIAAAMILVGLGLAGIYAATDGRVDCPDLLRGLAEKQVIFLGISLAVFALALAPSYVRLARYSYFLFGFSLALLAMLAIMRRFDLVIPDVIYPTNNAYSWINVPKVMKFQPSELTKITFIMALAYYLRYRKNYRTFRGLLTPFVMALVPTFLVLYQPDLGTAMMFLPVLFLMLFAAGARGKHLLAIILMGLAMVPVFYSSMKGYQRMRIDSWLLSSCAERMRFAISENREFVIDDPAAEPAATEPAASDPAVEAAGDSPSDQAPSSGDAAPPPTRPPKTRIIALTAEQQAELVQEITSSWRFRLWRLANAISWGKDKAEYVLARQRLFEGLDAGPGPAGYNALRMFFSSLLNDTGHQLFQAKIAVGSGGLTGRGWLGGTQTRYGFLPQAHTDFLFPTLAEQFGLLGAVGIVL
ncbi:MAG: FtsW/RodA/SpoVE family cell cycle protein, partial [Planctomycetota bacterium]|nr:FtsW/RodA/SpoVE family cell cycle protein [Planctomycetota bacterium]